mgnify:CR=1 FL=1
MVIQTHFQHRVCWNIANNNTKTPSRAAAGAAAAAAANAGGKTIISPVGGTIVEVKAKAGDAVKSGQELLILEAMKMQTSINSPVDGWKTA